MNLKLPSLSLPFLNKLQPLWRYRGVMFFVFVAALSMYLVFQINSAVNVAASADTEVTAATKTPRLDPVLVQQLQNLQDNSVTVRSLFNDGRENPFTN